MTRIGLSALAATLAAWAPGTAAADPQVTWTAPAGCPDAGHFAARVQAHLGDPQAADGIPVEVRITRADGRFALVLRTEHGERALDGEHCADLVEAAALIVAMALDQGAGLGPPAEQRPVWATDGEVPPTSGADLGLSELPRPRPGGPARVSLRLFAGGDVGAMPGPTAHLGLGAGIVVAPWRLEAGAHYLMERTAQGAEMDEGHRIGLFYGSLAVCHGRRLRLCAGGELGRFRAEAFGYPTVDTPRQSELWWGGLIGALVYARELGGPLSFRADAQVSAPLVRPRIGPGDTSTPDPTDLARLNHQPARVDGRVVAGLELVFP
jgi:hypothetical protein